VLLQYNPKAQYCIFIRKVIGYGDRKVKINGKEVDFNDPSRFINAWDQHSIPHERTYIFTDATELPKIDVAGGKCQP
jgi:hypothetical protein